MKYLVCEKPGKFILKEKPSPRRSPKESLVKIEMVGLCGTDFHAYKGNQPFFTYPRILGHELSGRILETDSSNFTVGQRVIIMPYINCGHCYSCSVGKTNCCVNMKVMGVHVDGGMQEEILVPNRLLLDAGRLTAEEVTIIEPLSIGAHALRRASIEVGSTVLVIGCGPIGVGIIKLAQIAGASVIAMDTNQARLRFVKETIGPSHVVNANQASLETIRDITNGDLASVVIDATGNKAALEKGVEYMSHGGRYVLVGLSKGKLEFYHPSIHAKECTLLCSRNATSQDFQEVRDLLAQKKFPSSSYITHYTKIERLADDIDTLLDPENMVIKAVVTF